MSGTRKNSKNTKFDKNRESSHEQIDVILSKFRRFALNLLRDTHNLKIIQMKTDLVRSKKERKKRISQVFLNGRNGLVHN